MDDAFDRLLEREAEIRRRLERGDISDDEADALRDLFGETDDGTRSQARSRMRVTVEQLGRIVDEGVNAESLRAVIELVPSMALDDAVDLVVEFEPCAVDLGRLAEIQRLTERQLREILDEGVEPASIEAVAAYGSPDPVAVALRLTQRGADVADLLRRLKHAGVGGLTVEQLEVVVDEDIDPRSLGRMVEACGDLPMEKILDLCVEDLDPEAIRRLRDQGIDVAADDFTARRGPAITLGVNLNLGTRHLLVGAGRERIRRSGTVSGFYVGDVTIDPGLTIDFAATLLGTLRIGAAADVSITGRVTGDVIRDEPAATFGAMTDAT